MLRRGLVLRLWPHPYEVARLRAAPGTRLPEVADGAPLALVVGADEVTLVAPAETVAALAELVVDSRTGWRVVTVEGSAGHRAAAMLAAASSALAEIDVPAFVFASFDRQHFLVPHRSLGRALAALHQARLERFL